MFETPGAANMTLETLSRLAAAFKVGLVVKFVPFSEMLRNENQYSQDQFFVTPLDRDIEFLDPEAYRIDPSLSDVGSVSFEDGCKIPGFDLGSIPWSSSQPTTKHEGTAA